MVIRTHSIRPSDIGRDRRFASEVDVRLWHSTTDVDTGDLGGTGYVSTSTGARENPAIVLDANGKPAVRRRFDRAGF